MQDDVNQHILRMFEGTSSRGEAQLFKIATFSMGDKILLSLNNVHNLYAVSTIFRHRRFWYKVLTVSVQT